MQIKKDNLKLDVVKALCNNHLDITEIVKNKLRKS